jgi:hypothetical protein
MKTAEMLREDLIKKNDEGFGTLKLLDTAVPT